MDQQQDDNRSISPELDILLSRALQIVQTPLPDCSDEELDILLNLISTTHVFQKNLDSQVSLEDFLQRIKQFITYETYAKGSVLFREGQYADRLCVILQGAAVRFRQKSIHQIELEEAQRNPGFMLQKVEEDDSMDTDHMASSPRQSPVNHTPKHMYLKSTTQASRMKITVKAKKIEMPKASPKKGGVPMDFVETPKTSPKKGGVSMNFDKNFEGKEEVQSFLNGSMGELDEGAEGREDQKLMRSMNLSPISPGREGYIEKQKKKFEKRVLKSKATREPTISDIMDYVDLDEEIDEEAEKIDIELFKLMCEKSPPFAMKYFLGDIFKLRREKELHTGNHFGEAFLKTNKRKENLLVASEDVQLLTITKENYSKVMSQLYEEVWDKVKFFLSVFPSETETNMTLFAYYFKEKVVKKGEKIYSEDEPTNCIYLLRSGDVQLFKNIDDSSQEKHESPLLASSRTSKLAVPITSIIEGQFFGEELLLRETKRAYTAVSKAINTKVLYLESWLYQKIKGNFADIFKTLRTQAREKLNWRHKRIEEIRTTQIGGSSDSVGIQLKRLVSYDSKSRAQTLLLSPHHLKPKVTPNGPEYYQVQIGSDNSLASELSRPVVQAPSTQNISDELAGEVSSATRNLEVYKEKFSRKAYIDNVLLKKPDQNTKSKANILMSSRVLDSLVPLKRNEKSCLSLSINQPQISQPSKRGSPLNILKDSEDLTKPEDLPTLVKNTSLFSPQFPLLSKRGSPLNILKDSEDLSKPEELLPSMRKNSSLSPTLPSARNIRVVRSNVLKFLTPQYGSEGVDEVVSSHKEVVKNGDGSLAVVAGRSRLRGILNSFELSPKLYDIFQSVGSPEAKEKIQLSFLQNDYKAESHRLKQKAKKKIQKIREHFNSPSDKLFKSQQESLNSLINAQKVSLSKHKI